MSANELVLIDLSSIAHPIWHMSQAEPDPNATSQKIVARVRALASEHPHAAVCCDSGRSFRHEISQAYKANRPESEAPLQHQITLAREQLAADGFPIWAVKGFEADDLIATGVTRALAMDSVSVLVISADKDLLQLVGPRVRQMSPINGTVLDEAGVFAKFGVKPEQMRDYLCLVGDSSDNVKGAKGIGPKKAAELLAYNGSLEGIYQHLKAHGSEFKPALASALREFEATRLETESLITLRSDVAIPFEEISAERVVKDAERFGMDIEDEDDMETDLQQPTAELVQPKDAAASGEAAKEQVTDPPGNGATAASSASRLNTQTGVAVRDAEILPAPKEWERGLDPRSQKEVITLATHVYNSRLFSAYGTPQGILTSIMLGRELGLPAMASLRGIHIIEGRHALAAQLMVALILKSGLAEYFRPIEISETSASYETLRKGDGNRPFTITHTIEMARTAQLVKPNSNWEKVPTDMLVARCQSRLARLIYPDIIGGLYTPDELKELRVEQAA